MNELHSCGAQLSVVLMCQTGWCDQREQYSIWEECVHRLLKSVCLCVGLSAGGFATAHAQSVSTLPPTGPSTAPTTTTTRPPSSTKIYPNPGLASQWEEEHYKPVEADSDLNRHPYSTPHFGPPPN
jgi:hypothetical protein